MLYNEYNYDKFDYSQLETFTFNETDEETELYYAYEDGFFTVGFPGMAPLLVFNSFPNKLNFNNSLGFVYRYVQGVKTVEGEEVEDPEIMVVT